MKYESNDRDRRRERAYERLGTRHPRCLIESCDEQDPLALTGTHPDIRCAEHDAVARGVAPIQGQHPAGQRNDPTILPTPANDHAVWDDLKKDWPLDTLRNPSGSPLLRISATIRGWLDLCRVMIERLFGWIPDFLERLDRWLTGKHGAEWWRDPELGWNAT